MNEMLVSVERMKRDIRDAAKTLSRAEARFLVDAYYQMQDDRIRADGRARELAKSGEPNAVVDWLGDQSAILEQQIKGALDRYSRHQPIGKWLQSIRGIGPVIAAGYMANLDITRRDDDGSITATTAGKWWSLCGLAPGRDRRVRGQKTTYNPTLKRLSWIAGESFKRLGSDDEEGYYRRWYDKRKAYETAKNENRDYADQAQAALAAKKIGLDTVARKWYEDGKLPPGHIDRRAARWAVKLFIAHMHEVYWALEFGDDPDMTYPKPYVLAHRLDYIAKTLREEHVDRIVPPNLDVVGLKWDPKRGVRPISD